jgi:hypothetical protein
MNNLNDKAGIVRLSLERLCNAIDRYLEKAEALLDLAIECALERHRGD